MEARVTGKAFQVVKDHHEVVIGLIIQKGQQGHHAGRLHKVTAACDRIAKDGHNLIALVGGMFAAACLLAFQTMAVRLLRLGQYPIMDDGALLR